MFSLRSKVIAGIVLALVLVVGWYKLRLATTETKLANSQLESRDVTEEKNSVVNTFDDFKEQKVVDEKTVTQVADNRLEVTVQSTVINEKVKHDAQAIRLAQPEPTQTRPSAADDAISDIVLDGMWGAYKNSLPDAGAGTTR